MLLSALVLFLSAAPQTSLAPQKLKGATLARTTAEKKNDDRISIGCAPTNIAGGGEWRRLKITITPPAGSPRLTVRSRKGITSSDDSEKGGLQ